MPIKKTTCYAPTCDICDEPFETDYIVHFESPQEAREHVETYGGAVIGDQVFCQDHIPLCKCGHTFQDHDHGDQPCEECAAVEPLGTVVCMDFAPAEDTSEQSLREAVALDAHLAMRERVSLDWGKTEEHEHPQLESEPE